MKSKTPLLFLALLALQLTGCVAIPPLIHVQESSNEGSKSRLDSLERRIERLEEKAAKDNSKI